MMAHGKKKKKDQKFFITLKKHNDNGEHARVHDIKYYYYHFSSQMDVEISMNFCCFLKNKINRKRKVFIKSVYVNK